MRDKNGVNLYKNEKTTCVDGDSCTCHNSNALCSVCVSLGCELDIER